MNPTFTAQDVEILSKESVYQGFLKIDKILLKNKLFSGGWAEPYSREVIVRPPIVAVLPYDPLRDQVVLLEQLRPGLLIEQESTPWVFQLVAGIQDHPGESLVELAHREMEEEAGLVAQELELISHYFVSPGASSEKVSLFCAKVDAREGGGIFGLAAEHEDIQTFVVDRVQAQEMLMEGKIRDAASLIALQWLALNYSVLKEKWNYV